MSEIRLFEPFLVNWTVSFDFCEHSTSSITYTNIILSLLNKLKLTSWTGWWNTVNMMKIFRNEHCGKMLQNLIAYSVKKCPLRNSDRNACWDMAQSKNKVTSKIIHLCPTIWQWNTINVKKSLSVLGCYMFKRVRFEFRQKVSSPKKDEFCYFYWTSINI